MTLIDLIRQLSRPLDPVPTDLAADLHALAVKAVVFDVYGTLFISGSGDIGLASETGSAQALADALQEAGFSGDLAAAGTQGVDRLSGLIRERHAHCRSQGVQFPEVEILDVWRQLLAELRAGNLLDSAPDAAALRLVAVGYECRVNPVWPMPGLPRLLHYTAQSGLRMGIVSNAQFYTPLLFEAFLGQPIGAFGFDERCCSWSYQHLQAKPSTAIFEPVLRQLRDDRGIRARDVLYVGNDCLNDMMPAQQLGCRTALFAGDRRSLRLRVDDVRCRGLEPDITLTNLSQLADVF